MITLRQITKTSEIIRLRDYYLLNLTSTGDNPTVDLITDIAMVQVHRNRLSRKAIVSVTEQSEAQIASSLARLLLGSTVIAEPEQLLFLKVLLENYGHEGELSFLPLLKLAYSLFPGYAGQSLPLIADFLEIKVPDDEPLLIPPLLSDELLQECKVRLGGRKRPVSRSASGIKVQPARRFQIDDKKLIEITRQIWSVTPWQFTLGLIAAAIAILLLMPRQQTNKTVDLSSPPVNYLVISWDDPGKYGKKLSSGENAVEFQVPYGVYSVLNNNSLPIEITVYGDEPETAPALTTVGKKENKDAGEEKEEENGPSTVQIRPSTSREITIDEGQRFTLSEGADDLIFFYLSAVPEETESTTTGQNTAAQVTVYKYVKGSEVRFRAGPSLESQVINTLNNGQQVQVLGIAGEWTNVKVQDKKGYIFSQYLTSDNPDATPTPETSASPEISPAAAADESAGSISDAAASLPSSAESGPQE
ncbi:MAG: SH3 domain-containing protein [Oscillospiraceae bacterium]|nr:SH3 domain-containing protein [Oscillospiraceae bacterium]